LRGAGGGTLGGASRITIASLNFDWFWGTWRIMIGGAFGGIIDFY